MLNETEQIKNLNSWLYKLGPEKTKKLRSLLRKTDELRENGIEIYPKQEDILRQIKLVSPSKVKVVIIGQDPYHEPSQAMGLSFSVNEGIPLPASLKNIFKELSSDLGCPIPPNGNLTKWAEQGVLLLNSVLTVEAHKANSFKDFGWQEITGKIIDICITLEQPVFFLCWGKQAESFVKESFLRVGKKNKKGIFISTHPSPLSANKATKNIPSFMGSHPFSKANNYLNANGSTVIDWNLC